MQLEIVYSFWKIKCLNQLKLKEYYIKFKHVLYYTVTNR